MLGNVKKSDMKTLVAGIEKLGLHVNASPARTGMVACTGSFGCKFANAETKGNALKLVDHIENKLELDEPLNIHMTGCPNSCAQHYVGDIGLLGARVADPDADDPEEADQVDGFHVYIGGGYEDEEGIARELATSIPVVHLNAYLENLLGLYLDERHQGERFVAYARRQDIDELKQRIAERSEKAAAVQRESEEKAYAEAEAKADTPEKAKTARDKAAQDDYDRQPARTKNTA